MTTISSYNNNNNNDLTNTSSLNISYVEIERLLNHNNDTINENANKKIATTTTTTTTANTASNLVISRDNERLKNLIRTSNWPSNHPIRKNLWTNLLQLNINTGGGGGDSINNNNNKNNNKYFNSNESEYIQYLNQIFGKCNFFVLK
jgi:hypothetical protein